MSTVCAQLESKILDVLRLALGDAATVVGFREAARAGTLKVVTGGKPEVRVTVSPGQAEGYSSPIMEFPCRVQVNLDLEDDPTQAAFDAVSAYVEAIVEAWNMNRNRDAMSAALTTDDFRVNGFRADSGTDALDLSRENPRISTTYAFAVKGVLTR